MLGLRHHIAPKFPDVKFLAPIRHACRLNHLQKLVPQLSRLTLHLCAKLDQVCALLPWPVSFFCLTLNLIRVQALWDILGTLPNYSCLCERCTVAQTASFKGHLSTITNIRSRLAVSFMSGLSQSPFPTLLHCNDEIMRGAVLLYCLYNQAGFTNDWQVQPVCAVQKKRKPC